MTLNLKSTLIVVICDATVSSDHDIESHLGFLAALGEQSARANFSRTTKH